MFTWCFGVTSDAMCNHAYITVTSLVNSILVSQTISLSILQKAGMPTVHFIWHSMTIDKI